MFCGNVGPHYNPLDTQDPLCMSTPALIEVVDDDDDVRRMLDIILQAHGFAVRLHASAQAYLNAESSAVRRVMLLDVRMPEMTGIELKALLEKRADPVPVIFMSGESLPHETLAAKQSDAVGFLWKPFRTQALLSAIGQGLEVYDQRQFTHPPSRKTQ